MELYQGAAKNIHTLLNIASWVHVANWTVFFFVCEFFDRPKEIRHFFERKKAKMICKAQKKTSEHPNPPKNPKLPQKQQSYGHIW